MFSKSVAVAALAAVAAAQVEINPNDISPALDGAVESIFATGLPVNLPTGLNALSFANVQAAETYLYSAYAPVRTALPSSLVGEYDRVVSSVFGAQASVIYGAQTADSPALVSSLASSINNIVSATAMPTSTAASSHASASDARSSAASSLATSARASAAAATSATSSAGALPTANVNAFKVAGLAGAAVGAAAFLL